MVPSTRPLRTSVNGEVTLLMRIQNVSDAMLPDEIVTVWPRVAVSGAEKPPNQTQNAPVRGGDCPPPVPHRNVHTGVSKFVEVSGSQNAFGIPPSSKPPSRITLDDVHVGDGVGVGVGVGVGDGDTDGDGVGVGVAPSTVKILNVVVSVLAVFILSCQVPALESENAGQGIASS